MDSVSSSIVGHHTQRSRVPRARVGEPSSRHAPRAGQVTHRAIYLVPAISPGRVSPGEGVKVQQVVRARRRGRLGREIPPRQKRRPALGIVPRKRSPRSALRGSRARPRSPRRTGADRCSGCRREDHPPRVRANSPRSCPLSPINGERQNAKPLSLQGRRCSLRHLAISTCGGKLSEKQKVGRAGEGPEQRSAYLSHHRAKLEGWTS